MIPLLYLIMGVYVASRMLSWISETKEVRISDFVLYGMTAIAAWPVIVLMWMFITAIDHSNKWDKVVIKKKDPK